MSNSLIRRPSLLPQSTFWDAFFEQEPFLWGRNSLSTGDTIPSVNIRQTEESFEVEVAAPGLKKEDFNIELDGNTLTISSVKETKKEEKDEDGYSRKEFSYQSFRRSFELPRDVVDEEKVKAKYDNGILRLSIPKKEEVGQKVTKRIKITD